MSANPEGRPAGDGKGGAITLNETFRIYPNNSVVAMPFSGGEAYYASQMESDGELIAITGTKKHYFRLDIAEALLTLSHKHLVPLLSWGIVDWSGNAQRLAMIFARPPGESIFRTLQSQDRHLSEAEVLSSVLPPVVSVLRSLSTLEIAHGSVHPDNLFLGADRGVMLGECISTAPSLNQPVWALTIERGLADPAGRGAGTIADDIYALGATLMCLTLGQMPLLDLSDEEIITRKLEIGSFAALLGKRPLSSSFAELLSGMLADNRKQRWNLDEIEGWIAWPRTRPRVCARSIMASWSNGCAAP
jgi:serine/threonine protein kinase